MLASRTGVEPCRRREREATYGNSKKLSGMDSALPHLRTHGNAYWMFNGRASSELWIFL